MYVRVAMMKLNPGHYDEMDAMAKSAPERIKDQKGFISAIYCSNTEKDEYGTILVWETKEDSDTAMSSMPSDVLDQIVAWSKEPSVINEYYVNNIFSA